MKKLSILAAGLCVAACCNVKAPEPMAVVPSAAQVEWQRMEMNMFYHFGPNTFTAAEWGTGLEPADVFNPSDLDCGQWVRTARDAGFKGVIITAKHHDGFCLWPNPVSQHTVAQSSWRDGKGDILKELSEACGEYGLKFGVYISPWDRHDPYYGTDEYNDVFVKTLNSALGDYGDVFEQWFDGACGEGPNGKRQVYDWPLFNSTVFSNHPNAIIFSDVGPGCRWVGNEEGRAGETCWATMDIAGYDPGQSPHRAILNIGQQEGSAWIPAETDVSIRPGWFYKDSENSKVKTVSRLLEIYYESVGRNSLLLLNVPPDKRGHIHEIDSTRLMEFRAALDEIFAVNMADGAKVKADNFRGNSCTFKPSNIINGKYDSYWAADDDVTTATLEVKLKGEKTFNRIMLQEYIPLGQRIVAFHIEVPAADGSWTKVAEGTTVGHKRILLTDTITASKLRIVIDEALACPTINGFGLFMDNVMEAAREAELKGKVITDGHIDTDLGSLADVKSFVYEPMKSGINGIILEYCLLASEDGSNWTEVVPATIFENIENNPIAQTVALPNPVKARHLRLEAVRTNTPDGSFGAAAFSGLTE